MVRFRVRWLRGGGVSNRSCIIRRGGQALCSDAGRQEQVDEVQACGYPRTSDPSGICHEVNSGYGRLRMS